MSAGRARRRPPPSSARRPMSSTPFVPPGRALLTRAALPTDLPPCCRFCPSQPPAAAAALAKGQQAFRLRAAHLAAPALRHSGLDRLQRQLAQLEQQQRRQQQQSADGQIELERPASRSGAAGEEPCTPQRQSKDSSWNESPLPGCGGDGSSRGGGMDFGEVQSPGERALGWAGGECSCCWQPDPPLEASDCLPCTLCASRPFFPSPLPCCSPRQAHVAFPRSSSRPPPAPPPCHRQRAAREAGAGARGGGRLARLRQRRLVQPRGAPLRPLRRRRQRALPAGIPCRGAFRVWSESGGAVPPAPAAGRGDGQPAGSRDRLGGRRERRSSRLPQQRQAACGHRGGCRCGG